MKAFRYCLLLPLIHLAISVPVIYFEEATYWRLVPRVQAEEDFEKTAPLTPHSGPMTAWDPCYEYRPSTADKFIFAVEFPAGMLIPPHGAAACNPTLLRPILQKLKSWIRLKTRIVLLDCFLVLGIVGQWWVIGRWIDHLHQCRKRVRRWIIPVATVTISAVAVAVSAIGNWRSLELCAIMFLAIALLAWVSLLLMFAVAAVQWALRLSWKGGPEYD